MFGDIEHALRKNLRDREYAEEYATSFLNAHIATQIKVIREQRGMTQADLGGRVGTTQAGISRYEDVNYSSWSLRTLMKLARAFDVRLRVSFEPFGTLPDEVVRFDRKNLERVKREDDPGLTSTELSPEAAILGNRGGNVVAIDIYQILDATIEVNRRPPAQVRTNQLEDDRIAYAEFSTGGSQKWR